MRFAHYSWFYAVILLLLLSGCRPVQAPTAPSPEARRGGNSSSRGTGCRHYQISPKDGAVFVYVPAGPFVMGSAADDAVAAAEEKPKTEVTTEGFWIMRDEVTNAQYVFDNLKARHLVKKGS